MTIKEVEEKLGIPRASIRFYEKERLINPKREENGYREYSEQDVATLKKVVLFRKLGLAVSEIEDILDGTLPLTDALTANVQKLEEQLAELNGAIEMSRAILKAQPDINTLDGEFYYEEVEREEARGSRFMDIAKDIVGYQKSVFLDYYGLADAEGGLRVSPVAAVFTVIAFSLIWGTMNWLFRERALNNFLIGLATPLLTVLVLFIVGYPIHCLAKKHPKLKKHEKATGLVVLIIAIFLVLAFLDLCKRFGW
ncbi:MAG: MerR family transcriptional regulator [Paludibacteraceae bacterium]|nr:MerR family transcriptional regulator [Paludibacteraceae bacterium]